MVSELSQCLGSGPKTKYRDGVAERESSECASVLWLCKRQYMSKDVIDDCYGRLYELPKGLSRFFKVSLVAYSYYPKVDRNRARGSGSFVIYGRSGRTLVMRTLRWLSSIASVSMKGYSNSVIYASSDVFHVISGGFLSRLLRVPFFVDLYDNYESFEMARLPFFKYLYRRALSRASGISVVSSTLSELISQKYRHVPNIVIESTIDKSLFFHRDKADSRARLGLEGSILVGVCGGLNSDHDIETVYRACEILYGKDVSFTLLVAGKQGEIVIPEVSYITRVGVLSHADMPYFFSALDVALIPMSNGEFGQYAFPQKAYEIVACKVPVVAAKVGALEELFCRFGGVTYEPGNPESLAQAIIQQLDSPVVADIEVPDWTDQCEKLNAFICGTLAENPK